MTSHAQRWLIGLGAVALATSLGCQRNTTGDRSANAPAANAQGTATAASQKDNPDWWTTTKVQAKFFADSTVKGRDIDVTTTDGVVTLTGVVDSQEAKSRAEAVARGVDGVKSVDDQLAIREANATAPEPNAPVATTGRDLARNRIIPAWITTKIQAQYYAEPDIKPWNIDVTTMGNGVVTLSGTVDNDAARRKAIGIARNTNGVTAVDDRLRLRSANAASGSREGAEPDAWITAKVQSKYFMDDEVKGRDIDVTTRDGVVTLSGTVGSDAEHAQAVAIATNTDGVTRVQDRLQVQAPAATPLPSVRPLSNLVSNDEWITTKIRSRFFIDPTVKNVDVHVTTKDGVVTLTGQVRDDTARAAADRIARNVSGVKEVRNRLTIKQ